VINDSWSGVGSSVYRTVPAENLEPGMMEIVAVAAPYSVLPVSIARPSRSARTVTSPCSTVRSAIGGRIVHSVSRIGDPDESTIEKLADSVTSIEAELGVIVTAEDVEVCCP